MRFIQKCLKCNQIIKNDNYTCQCTDTNWRQEYRMMDINYRMTPSEKKEAIRSLEHYKMGDPQGILQYYFTPNREHAGEVKLKVGLTPFIELGHLSKKYDTGIYLKNEGANPSGCFKDRETLMAALHSKSLKKQKAVIYSSGNAAASAALFAAHLDFKLITCVAGDTYPEKINYIRERGSDVIVIGGPQTNYEEGYRLFAKLNSKGFFTENDFDNWSVRNPFRALGDKTTAIEIVKQYSEKVGEPWQVPDFVVVPTGNGSCLAGIWRGFKELKKLGVIEELPRMVSAAIKNASPVYKAFEHKMIHRPAICDLSDVDPRDMEIGSIILAEEGYDSVEATRALIESNGLAVEVNKRDIRNSLVDMLENERSELTERNLIPEPASLVTIAAIEKMRSKNILSDSSRTVALISGHGAKAKDLLMKLLIEKPDLQQLTEQIIEARKKDQKDYTNGKTGKLIKVNKSAEELEEAFRTLNSSLHESILSKK